MTHLFDTSAAFALLLAEPGGEWAAAGVGLSDAKIATTVAGGRPADLSAEEAAAYDVATALARGGSLPGAAYWVAVAAFGEEGFAELAYLAGT